MNHEAVEVEENKLLKTTSFLTPHSATLLELMMHFWLCLGLWRSLKDYASIVQLGRSSQIWPTLHSLVMRRDVRNYCPDGNSTVKCVKFLILHGPHNPYDDE